MAAAHDALEAIADDMESKYPQYVLSVDYLNVDTTEVSITIGADTKAEASTIAVSEMVKDIRSHDVFDADMHTTSAAPDGEKNEQALYTVSIEYDAE